jgi:hypothetical protein
MQLQQAKDPRSMALDVSRAIIPTHLSPHFCAILLCATSENHALLCIACMRASRSD